MNDILSLSVELKAVYQDMKEYQELRKEDKIFFDNLFILLLFNEDKVYSNKYLSQRFNIPISTIEKRIKRLAQCNLIKRSVESTLINGKWITTARSLELDPATFSFMKAKSEEERLYEMRKETLSKGKYIPKDDMNKVQDEVHRALAEEKTFFERLQEIR